MIPLIILAIENDDDREFMISLYIDFYPMMKQTAKKVVKEDDVAEDMVHETIAYLIGKLDTIRGLERRRLVSYIKKSTHNASLNYYNKSKHERSYASYVVDGDSIPDNSCSPVERFEILEEYEELAKVIKQLPEREREILYLKYNMQVGDEEIGRIMGIQKDSVRQYLTRARRIAKEYILKEGAIVE